MNSPEISRFHYWKQWLLLIALTLLVSLPGLSNLPVIDRDEARFAQASVQMVESGDLINIRFQDEARNKKPAGIYWLQTAAIKTFGKTGDRAIWVQRLPSVLGALIAVLATYWGAARMIGRRGAFIAASMLALSALMVFEAHIAKTDAMLCGLAATCFAALAHIRNGGQKSASWIFWIALGASIMIKGPVVPILVLLTIISLVIWERRNQWMRAFLNWPAIIVFLLMWVPWAVMMWVTTDGAFFAESLGKDFGGKIISGQEKHGAPPGYHFVAIWLTLWPTCLLLIPGFAFAFRAVKHNNQSDEPVIKAMRLCLSWIIPYWVLVEIMPTKLPHYTLPLFPALCVISAAAALTLLSVDEFKVTRRINAVIYLIISTILIGGIMGASGYFGDINYGYYIIGIISGFVAIIATFSFWRGNMKWSLITGALSTIILTIPTYSLILPNLTQLRPADKLVELFEQKNILPPREGGPPVASPDFTEPSLVYHLGTNIDVSGKTDLLDMEALKKGRVIILDQKTEKAAGRLALLKIKAIEENICSDTSEILKSYNYSKGDALELIIFRAIPCAQEPTNETPDE